MNISASVPTNIRDHKVNYYILIQSGTTQKCFKKCFIGQVGIGTNSGNKEERIKVLINSRVNRTLFQWPNKMEKVNIYDGNEKSFRHL